MLQNHRNYIWAASLHIMISLFDRDQGIAISLLCALQRAIVDLEKIRVPHLKMLHRKIIVLNCISVQGFIIDPLPDRPSHVMIRFVTIKVRTVEVGQAMIKLILSYKIV